MSEITDKHWEATRDILSLEAPSGKEITEILKRYFHEPMDEARARTVLGDWIQEDGGLFSEARETRLLFDECFWMPAWGIGDSSLCGRFTAEQLEAIAFWMRNKGA